MSFLVLTNFWGRVGKFLGILGILWACQLPTALTPTPPAVLPTPAVAATTFSVSLSTPPPPAGAFTPWVLPAVQGSAPFLGPGVRYEGVLTAGTEQIYRIANMNNRDLFLWGSGAGGLDIALQIRTSTGEVVATADEEGPNGTEFLRFQLPNNELYELFLSGGSGSYMVSLVDLSLDPSLFALNLTEFLGIEGGRHLFTATAGRSYLVTVTPDPGLDVIVEIYDEGGFLLNRDTAGYGEVESFVFTPAGSGSYWVLLFGFEGSADNYTVQVLELP